MQDLLYIYESVCDFMCNSDDRAANARIRKAYLQPNLIKVAFDTRRTNQNTDVNPRQNLQYYQRSEPYINEKTADQVKLLFKVKAAVDDIREEFIGEPDWLNSHTRILCNAIDETLRVNQNDFDYSERQLDYISELLYVRYRLQAEDITSATPTFLRQTFLNKDEILLRRGLFTNYKKDLEKTTTYQDFDMQKNSDITKTTKSTKPNKVKVKGKGKDVDKSITININVNNDNENVDNVDTDNQED